MKRVVVLLMVAFSLAACEEEELQKALAGTWVNVHNPSEKVVFKDAEQVNIHGHDYKYRIKGNSVYFDYAGTYYILCLTSEHEFSFDEKSNELIVDNIGKLCLVEGSEGTTRYKKSENANTEEFSNK